MTLKTFSLQSLAIVLLALCTSTVILPPETAQAQRRFGPVNRAGRWLGLGFSDGYHRANPGPNTGYYNPYNRHNSYLLSRDPAYIQQYGDPGSYGNSFQPQSLGYYLQNGGRLQGGGSVPYSVYAPTNNRGTGSYGGSYRGQVIDSQFEEDTSDTEEDAESILGFGDEGEPGDETDSDSTRANSLNNDFQPANSAFSLQSQPPIPGSSDFEPVTPIQEIDEHKFDAYKEESSLEGFEDDIESIKSSFEPDTSELGEITEAVLEEIK